MVVKDTNVGLELLSDESLAGIVEDARENSEGPLEGEAAVAFRELSRRSGYEF